MSNPEILAPEILAPAGNFEMAYQAAMMGANAVFFGCGEFHARSASAGIPLDRLEEFLDFVHLHNMKAYMTFNTLIFQDERIKAIEHAVMCANAGVDAFIVQDVGLASFLHENMPYMPIHASTQMAVNSLEALENAKRLGLSRIVLPRELSLSEIWSVTSKAKEIGIETEVFVHGAQCVSCSGHCHLSYIKGGRSANRGACAQPCRLKYSLNRPDSPSNPILSPKDMSSIDYLTDLIKAGVSSFKIEGRMRSPQYVRTAVRMAVKSASGQKLTNDDRRDLLLSYSRGGSFSQHRIIGCTGRSFLSGNVSGHLGIKIGEVAAIKPEKGEIFVHIDDEADISGLVKGSDIVIRRKDGTEVANAPAGSVVRQNQIVVIRGFHPKVLSGIPKNTEVFQTSSPDLLKNGEERQQVIPVDARLLRTADGKTYVLTFSYNDDFTVNIDAEAEEINPLSKDRVRQQISKFGGTSFYLQNFESDESVYLRISTLNAMRRHLIEAISKQLIQSYRRNITEYDKEQMIDKLNSPFEFLSQLPKCKSLSPNINSNLFRNEWIYLPGWIRGENDFETGKINFVQMASLLSNLKHSKDEVIHLLQNYNVVCVIPPLAPLNMYEEFKTHIGFFVEHGLAGQAAQGLTFFEMYDIPLIFLDDSNMTNSWSIKAFENITSNFTERWFSLACETEEPEKLINEFAELNFFSQTGLRQVMQYRFCPIGKGNEGCKLCENKKIFSIFDSKGNKLYCITQKEQKCSGLMFANFKNHEYNNPIKKLVVKI